MYSDEENTIGFSSDTRNNMQSTKSDLSFTILWSPLPVITWIIPFIGHLGIADSKGVASDFRGPYFVGDDGRMAFGAPTRSLKVDIGDLPGGAERWDEAIQEANSVYRGRMHNLFCDNCHSHVANALNRMPIKAPLDKWNMVILCFVMFLRGNFLSKGAVLMQFGPFAVFLLIFLLVRSL